MATTCGNKILNTSQGVWLYPILQVETIIG